MLQLVLRPLPPVAWEPFEPSVPLLQLPAPRHKFFPCIEWLPQLCCSC